MSPHLVDNTMFWSAASGGVRRYVMAKRTWMQAHTDWRHTIATPVSVDDANAGTARVPAVALPFSGGYRLPLRRAAASQVLRRLAPSLIEAGDPYRLAWASLDAAHALQIPAVAFCHSNLEAMGRQFGGAPLARMAARYARHLYGHFDLVLAPSESMRHALLQLGLDRVERQALGCDSLTFHPDRRDPAWRASIGLPQDARVLVFAGRFAPEKHLDVLARAVQKLGAPYVLLAIGAGPTPPPASERVLVRPFEPNAMALARALASADAFVHAGDQETFGLAALEAMACGTPLIARKAAGLAELVDAQVGAAIEGAGVSHHTQAIESVFAQDEAGLAALRRQARARAESYDWTVVMPQLFGRYQRLLAQSSLRVETPPAATPPLHQKP